MKKAKSRYFYLLLITVFVLSGCGKEKRENISSETTDLNINQSAPGFFVETEQGYYFMLENFFYYSEKEEVNFIKLCSKPDCLHRDADCNAYVPGGVGYNAHLYQGELVFPYTESGENQSKMLIGSKNPDGTDFKQEKGFEVPLEGAYSGRMHRNYFFYNTVEIAEDGSQHSTFYMSNLDDLEGEPVIIHQYTEKEETKNAEICESACVGEYMYYSAAGKKYRYDIQKRESGEVAGYVFAPKGEYYTENGIYQLDMEDNFTYLDTVTGEQKTLKKEEDENIVGPVFSDGERIYRLNYSYGEWKIPDEYNGIFIYDMEGNRIDYAKYTIPTDNNIYFATAEDKVLVFRLDRGSSYRVESYSWFKKKEIGTGKITWHDKMMQED